MPDVEDTEEMTTQPKTVLKRYQHVVALVTYLK